MSHDRGSMMAGIMDPFIMGKVAQAESGKKGRKEAALKADKKRKKADLLADRQQLARQRFSAGRRSTILGSGSAGSSAEIGRQTLLG